MSSQCYVLLTVIYLICFVFYVVILGITFYVFLSYLLHRSCFCRVSVEQTFSLVNTSY
jgi:hypothetical protein